MEIVEILGIPKIEYARIISSPKNDQVSAPTADSIEISYVAEGDFTDSIDGKSIKRSIYDVTCTIHREADKDVQHPFHERHTVCFNVPYKISEGGEGSVCLPEQLQYSSHTEIHRLINEIIRMYTLSPERTYTLGGLVLQLLDEINAESFFAGVRSSRKSSLYEYRAIDYIYENVHKPITQKDIAAYLGITPEYFSAVFKKSRGMSPMQFINRVKLSSIRMAMAKDNIKLYEASEKFGFSDPNYVSKLFKKYYGINITSSIPKK